MVSDNDKEYLQQLRSMRLDLNTVLAECKLTLKDMKAARQALENMVESKMHDAAAAEIAKLGEATEKAMTESVEKVGREFDKLAQTYLGTASKNRKRGQKSLEELARDAANRT